MATDQPFEFSFKRLVVMTYGTVCIFTFKLEYEGYYADKKKRDSNPGIIGLNNCRTNRS